MSFKKLYSICWAIIFFKCIHFSLHFQDHHNELRFQNVLKISDSIERTAEYFSITTEAVEEVLEECRNVLYEARLKRPKPHLDNKMLTAWNGN